MRAKAMRDLPCEYHGGNGRISCQAPSSNHVVQSRVTAAAGKCFLPIEVSATADRRFRCDALANASQLLPRIAHTGANQFDTIAVAGTRYVTLHVEIACVQIFVLAQQSFRFWIVHDIDEVVGRHMAGYSKHVLTMFREHGGVIIESAVEDAE
jgi:hypothetical protein